MRVDVLGPLVISSGDGRLDPPARRAGVVLCWLVLRANHSVELEWLADVVWSDGSGSVAKARLLVRSLAPLLAADAIKIDGDRVRLVLPDDAVDAWRFERLVTDARQHAAAGDRGRADANLEAALGLWRGDPYPELDRSVVAMGEIERLIELRLTALEDFAALALAERADYALVADLSSWVLLHPDRPRLRRQLALALYRAGRQVDALAVVRDLCSDLGDDTEATQRLQSGILRHDARLVGTEYATFLELRREMDV